MLCGSSPCCENDRQTLDLNSLNLRSAMPQGDDYAIQTDFENKNMPSDLRLKESSGLRSRPSHPRFCPYRDREKLYNVNGRCSTLANIDLEICGPCRPHSKMLCPKTNCIVRCSSVVSLVQHTAGEHTQEQCRRQHLQMTLQQLQVGTGASWQHLYALNEFKGKLQTLQVKDHVSD